MSCLDEVGLERLRLDLATPAQQAHVATCPECQARVAQMAKVDEDFHRFVFPRTVDAVLASRRPRRWGFLALALVPVAAALVLVLRPVAPPQDYVGLKGSTLGLAVFTLDPSGAPVQLADGARVSANAALRFRVAPSRPCHLWVFSLDGQGQVSRLFPAEGPAPLVSAETTLPGGATLDGLAGPERVFAVCSPSPLEFSALEALAAGVPVRETAAVPLDAIQGSLLLEKAR